MKESRPNVILVITDDQGYGDLGCHGNPVALTPHLDRLHGESVRFTDFHACPMCTPTRGQLLTGLDAARNGALNVSSGRTLLRAELPTLADVFRAAGYRTGQFGKWHLGDNYPFRPEDRGFDESLWFPSSHISSLPDYWGNDYFDDVYCHNGKRESFRGYCTEVFFDHAMDWIDACARRQEPFFAYLPTNAPHYPLWVPAENRATMETFFAQHEHVLPSLEPAMRENIIRFLAMIQHLDGQVGRLRNFLQNRGLADNTIFIFMTDNGSTFGPAYYNAGMRGGKCTLWEGGHRVPCFMHWPDGGLNRPCDIPGLAQVQDILPTLAEFCGLETPDDCDGISLAGALRQERPLPDERMLVVNYSRMPGEFDYPSPDSPARLRPEGAAVLWRHWRLLGGTALYDLGADPGQTTDVADHFPEVVARLRQHLDDWWTRVEPLANRFQRIIVGSEAENPTRLSACEWADVFVDQQLQVRAGVSRNSYWHLYVDRPGEYDITLRRWPEESGLRLREACPETTVTDGIFPPGRALPISRARIYVGGMTRKKKVEEENREVTFRLHLEAGPTLLHSWFDDERQQPLCGAYYVTVYRREE